MNEIDREDYVPADETGIAWSNKSITLKNHSEARLKRRALRSEIEK